MKLATELFLEVTGGIAQDANRFHLMEEHGWYGLQQQFLQGIDEYVQVEMSKPIEVNIGKHEAGGQFRIAFPHYAVRGDERISDSIGQYMESRKAWTDANLYHGFPDCCEVHHEIETFIYFQLPLYYWGMAGKETALQSIEDVAHHIGNWSPDTPVWYDWEKHGFVSCWIGTRSVRDYAPYDYQEANHFRYSDVAMAAYLGTGNKRYLDFMRDYADRWCDHIDELAAKGEPIQCSILPKSASVSEMGFSGSRKDGGSDYKVFYTLVSDNTAYDIAGHLLDLYWVTREERYVSAARLLMDQFITNGKNGRPAKSYTESGWHIVGEGKLREPNTVQAFVTDCTFLSRLAIRHDLLTGTTTYRKPILEWAAQIDEKANVYDQMMSNVLVAAHFYDGDASWLTRAYAMALRTAQVVEGNDEYHQCNWSASRQGTKFLMELLYQPMLGGAEWGTRGNIPMLLFKHETNGNSGIPDGVAFRTWLVDKNTFGFEAVNTTDLPKVWKVASWHDGTIRVNRAEENNRISLQPGETRQGTISFDHTQILRNPDTLFRMEMKE